MAHTGKMFVVTGASRGLGRDLALHFARKGAYIVLVARASTQLEQVALDISEQGGRCATYSLDLRVSDDIERFANALVSDVGVPDVVINNAADVTSRAFLDTSPEQIESLIRTNLIAPLLLARLLAPRMVARGNGAIVNVSSLAGYKPNIGQTVYSISKGGLNAASRALNAELRSQGVHVLNVALASVGEGPGKVAPADVSSAIEDALDHGAEELFFSLSSKWLMRLYGLCPSLMRLV